MKNSRPRIEREKRIVSQMISLYCCRREGNRVPCAACRELETYAHRRLDACRYGEAKPACKRCMTHCYAPAQRERIRRVMRFSGPLMILYAPLEALRHWIGR